MHNVRFQQQYKYERAHNEEAYWRKAIQMLPLQLQMCDIWSSEKPHEDTHRGKAIQVQKMRKIFQSQQWSRKTSENPPELRLGDFWGNSG